MGSLYDPCSAACDASRYDDGRCMQHDVRWEIGAFLGEVIATPIRIGIHLASKIRRRWDGVR